HMLVGNLPTALRHSTECLRLMQAHFPHEAPALVVAFGVHAMILHVAGRWEESERAFHQMWELTEHDLGVFSDIVASHQAYYCEYLIDRHEWLEEELRSREIERLVDAIPPHGLPRILAELARGRSYLLAGDLEGASRCLEPAVEGLLRVRNTEFVVVGYLGRARLNRTRRDFNLARQDVAKALTRACDDGLRLSEVNCRIELAAVAVAERKREEAVEQLGIAGRLIDQCGYQRASLALKSVWKRFEEE
ncbi:MAG TPA: hypothetical protein VGL53_11790, partial [Bryobacteraceae bacterium]